MMADLSRTSRWARRLARLGAVLALGAVPHVANAQPQSGSSADQKAVAEAHFNAALGYLELERYAQAAEELEKSVAAYPTAAALFNLGNAYQALHRYVDARATFRRLLAEGATELKPELREALDRHLHEVEGLIGRLTVRVTPEFAALSLNGRPHVNDGGEILLDPGSYLVRATLDGYRPAEQSVTLRPGDQRSITLELERALATLTLTATPAGAEVFVDGVRRGVVPLAAPLELEPGRHRVEVRHPGHHTAVREIPVDAGARIELALSLAQVSSAPAAVDSEPRDRGVSPAFWVAAGATVLTTGASVTLAILASNKDDTLERKVAEYERLPSNTAQTRFDQRHAELEELQSDRDALHVTSLALGGVALAGVALSAVLGWELFAPAAEPARTGMWLTPNGVGGRF